MSELESKVEGILVQDHTLVSDKDMQHSLEQRGFGEVIKNKFMLEPFESLYLLYIDKLNLVKGKQQVDFDNLLDECIKHDQDIFTKFLIYRDLRTRGYIAKDGFGFGSDFRVYERGQFGEKGTKYVVFGMTEGRRQKIGELQKKIEQITTMGKEPVLAVIERRGEVIYYKVSRIQFHQNKDQKGVSSIEF
ncbi:MAG: tRNA-intron lyase [Thaumarchaeota archaeon]|nr:MAG: tRNA-intron lyase [Nitrososphaerota archaeon]TLX93838.1 MAG: tRNA-intron lyase [Nitrososphaerota archaeon]